MTAELKPCPCGKVPDVIHAFSLLDGREDLILYGDCCRKWAFITTRPPRGTTLNVNEAWNAAPRPAALEGWQSVPIEKLRKWMTRLDHVIHGEMGSGDLDEIHAEMFNLLAAPPAGDELTRVKEET